MRELIIAAPLSFLIGVAVGLMASSRWLIVRRRPPDDRS